MDRIINSGNRGEARRGLTSQQFLLYATAAVLLAFGGLVIVHMIRHNSTWSQITDAGIELDHHDPATALSTLESVLDRHPTGPALRKALLLQARAKLMLDREGEALDAINKVLADHPQDVDALQVFSDASYAQILKQFMDVKRNIKLPMDLNQAQPILDGADATVQQFDAALSKAPAVASLYIGRAMVLDLKQEVYEEAVRQEQSNKQSALARHADLDVQQAQQHLEKLHADDKNPPSEDFRNQAIANLQTSLEKDPKNERAAALVQRYYQMQGRHREVLDIAAKMAALNAETQEIAQNAARSIYNDKQSLPKAAERLAQAENYLKTYLEKNPDQAGAQEMLGELFLDGGDVASAEAQAEAALKNKPLEPQAQELLATCKLRENNAGEAIALLQKLLSGPAAAQPQVWYLLGQAYLSHGAVNEAQTNTQNALNVDPEYDPALRLMVNILQREGRIEEAQRYAKQVNDPFYMPARMVEIQTLLNNGQEGLAQQEVLAMAKDPALTNDDKPNVIQLLAQVGRPQEAEALIDTMPQNTPHDMATGQRLRAMLAAARNDFASAESFLQDAVAKDPSDIDTRLQYADVILQRGLDRRGAHDEFDTIAKQIDGQISAGKEVPLDQTIKLAQGYLLSRDPEKAEKYADLVRGKSPNDVDAIAVKVQAEGLKDPTKARDLLPEIVGNGTRTPAEYVRLAALAVEQRNFDEALQLAGTGRNQDPTNVDLHLLMAEAYRGKAGENAAQQNDLINFANDEIRTAIQQNPDDPRSFDELARVFSDPKLVAHDSGLIERGISQARNLGNPALANLAMGRLQAAQGAYEKAMACYSAGLSAGPNYLTDRIKLLLDQAKLDAFAAQKDESAFDAAVEEMAKDPSPTVSVGVRFIAAEHDEAVGRKDAVLDNLTKLSSKVDLPPRLRAEVALRWGKLGKPENGIAILEKLSADDMANPAIRMALIALYQQANRLTDALATGQALHESDPTNPATFSTLALLQSANNDFPGALKTLDECAKLGVEGSRTRAEGMSAAYRTRVRIYYSLGLLNAADEQVQNLAKMAAETDFATNLQIGQSWAGLNKPAEARQALEQIKPWAQEYADAQITLANLDANGGQLDAAVARLRKLVDDPTPPPTADYSKVREPYFEMLLRAGNAGEAQVRAMAYRKESQQGSAPWINWTILAATAARDAGQYGQTVALLQSMAPLNGKNPAASDMALVYLVQNDLPSALSAMAQAPADQMEMPRLKCIGLLAQPGTAAAQSIVQAIKSNRGGPQGSELSHVPASLVLAILAASPPEQWESMVQHELLEAPTYTGDLESTIASARAAANPALVMQRLALVQQLLELHWPVPALAVLGEPAVKQANAQLALVQAHQAFVQLQRTAETDDELKQIAAISAPMPTARLVLATQDLNQGHFPEALAQVQAVDKTEPNRNDVLNAEAQILERMHNYDAAIAINQQLKRDHPGDVGPANNLAYLFTQAHPDDPAALAEAKKEIDWAIARAPDTVQLEDTRGWVDLLNHQPAAAYEELRKAIVPLRMQAAVHYHLGLTYMELAKAGNNPELSALAILHLKNVAAIADPHENMPEVQKAQDALKLLETAGAVGTAF